MEGRTGAEKKNESRTYGIQVENPEPFKVGGVLSQRTRTTVRLPGQRDLRGARMQRRLLSARIRERYRLVAEAVAQRRAHVDGETTSGNGEGLGGSGGDAGFCESGEFPQGIPWRLRRPTEALVPDASGNGEVMPV